MMKHTKEVLKVEKNKDIFLAMKMLGQVLDSKGYKTKEDILKLCKEIRKRSK